MLRTLSQKSTGYSRKKTKLFFVKFFSKIFLKHIYFLIGYKLPQNLYPIILISLRLFFPRRSFIRKIGLLFLEHKKRHTPFRKCAYNLKFIELCNFILYSVHLYGDNLVKPNIVRDDLIFLCKTLIGLLC